MRRIAALAFGLASVCAVTLLQAPTASATVHEIVGQWCSGQDPLAPPGITGRSNADNFAQPLEASGFIQGIAPFQDGFLVQFNYDAPQAKVVGTGVFIVIGAVEGQPLYLELITPDPGFPAFQRCPRLATG